MANVVIFGTGQMAEVAKFYLDWEGSHKVVAFAVNQEYLREPLKDGLPVVAWEGLESSFSPSQVSLFAPISYKGVNQHRVNKFNEGLDRGYDFISFIHPKAHYYDTPVGRNTFIMEANVIQPHVTIGDNCILWSGNHIGHHTHILDHTFIASHVVVSGGVEIGMRCFIGVNATIRDNVKIGHACVIGAGAIVLSDLPDRAVVPGEKSEVSRLTSDKLRRI
ncbi:transferase [Paramesorhizobium deserti]|uniref:Transferase n=1 Tax=Paramesorhizobium deserti TaxID=1494590 RepID=A0A135HP63_9HYPH|nr:acetyltransferase [Paramesorhizobium deserti]KXF75002.1 transferase [Paramesorhizobium deserti]